MIFVLMSLSAATGLSQKQGGGNSNQSISSRTERAQTTADNSSQVDALMARWSQGNTPGAVTLVVRDGRVLHEKGYGVANVATKEPINSTTVFDIASVSKQFTAMAIMILVERGTLHYTDTLSRFFPEFQPLAQRITVSQLLNHTSGILDYSSSDNASSFELAIHIAHYTSHHRPGGTYPFSVEHDAFNAPENRRRVILS